MKMQWINTSLLTMALVGCGDMNVSHSNLSSHHDHHQASACEIELSEVKVWRGSQNSRTFELSLQVSEELAERGVDEIGFRNRGVFDTTLSVELNYDFRNDRAVINEDGEYKITKSVTGEFGSAEFQGAFYVRSKDGQTYWLQPAPFEDFALSQELFTQLLSNSPTAELGHATFKISESEHLFSFDPYRCAQ